MNFLFVAWGFAIFTTLVKYGLIMCFSCITLVDMAFIGLLKALWRNTESKVGRKTLSVVLPQPVRGLTDAFQDPACGVKVQTVKVG